MKGEVDQARGDLENALTFYDRAIASNARLVPARRARIRVLLKLGRLEDAKTAVGELRKTSPFDPGVTP